MRSKTRCIAVLLAIFTLLAHASFALAADAFQGSTFTVTAGASKQLELYRLFTNDSWGTVDTSTIYKDFTIVSSGNDRIAAVAEHDGVFHIIGVNIGVAAYTATTANGDTFEGYINVISRAPAGRFGFRGAPWC